MSPFCVPRKTVAPVESKRIEFGTLGSTAPVPAVAGDPVIGTIRASQFGFAIHWALVVLTNTLKGVAVVPVYVA
jgi:hypothetical protein